MEVIRHQSIGQDPYAAKGLQPSHQEHKSFGPWGPVAGGLENELTVDHSGNAVVKTLTLSLDARESHGREAHCTEQKIKVKRKRRNPPIFDLSLLVVLESFAVTEVGKEMKSST